MAGSIPAARKHLIDAIAAQARTPRGGSAVPLEQFVKDYGWDGPVFAISALDGTGCSALTYAIMDYLATQAPRPVEEESAADAPASETPTDTPATDTPDAD